MRTSYNNSYRLKGSPKEKKNAVLTKQVRKKEIMATYAVLIDCVIYAVIPRCISGSAQNVLCEIR